MLPNPPDGGPCGGATAGAGCWGAGTAGCRDDDGAGAAGCLDDDGAGAGAAGCLDDDGAGAAGCGDEAGAWGAGAGVWAAGGFIGGSCAAPIPKTVLEAALGWRAFPAGGGG